MKTGRELDAKIAEIMGYKEIWQPFFPSTEIADAWIVRKWLLDNVGGVKLERVCDYENPESCEVWTKEGPIRVQAKTTPLAICLATLKACGVKITS